MRIDDYITNEEIRLMKILRGKNRMEQDEILGQEEQKFPKNNSGSETVEPLKEDSYAKV